MQTEQPPEPDHTVPVTVSTAAELSAAVSSGVRHIQVAEHIDLRGQPLARPWNNISSNLGVVSITTTSIVVRTLPA